MSLKTDFANAGLSFSVKDVAQLQRFLKLFLKKNQELNLTAIRTEEDAQLKHIVDSVMLLKFYPLKPGQFVLDLGTGGGIPGIPLAILCPQVNFVLVDSVQKKITAVQQMIDELKLTNVRAFAGRAEELAREPEFREEFDVVLSRALAPLRVLLELTLPFTTVGGKMIAYKGIEVLSELTAAQSAIATLKAEKPQIKRYSLPGGMGERSFMIFDKKNPIPADYPRPNGTPKKRPL